MNIKSFALALNISCYGAGCYAAALDLTGQSITSFLQDGHYFEASMLTMNSHIQGELVTSQDSRNISKEIKNIDVDYASYNTALKIQLHPNISVGLIYDQPFGQNARYIEFGQQPASSNRYDINIDTQNLSFLLGYSFNPNSKIYAGLVHQTLKANYDFNGQIYHFSGQYDADMKEDNASGWLVGGSYKIPEIGLQMDMTYRSNIKHRLATTEYFDFPIISPVQLVGQSQTTIETPQSVNLNMQIGFFKQSLLMLHSRWVNWKQFKIRPEYYGQAVDLINMYLNQNSSHDLYSFNKDQWTVTLGLGKALNSQWSGAIFTGLDKGSSIADRLVSTDNWLAGIGVQFNPTRQYFLSGGLVYIGLGNSKHQTSDDFVLDKTSTVSYKNNDAWVYMLKMGYHF
nr:hypothetical protein [Acinetobacter sp. Marseille-Q1620]